MASSALLMTASPSALKSFNLEETIAYVYSIRFEVLCIEHGDWNRRPAAIAFARPRCFQSTKSDSNQLFWNCSGADFEGTALLC